MGLKQYTLGKDQFNQGDMFLSISLTHDFNMLGAEDDLKTYRQKEVAAAMPPIVDSEWIRFRYSGATAGFLAPAFISGTTLANSYLAAGFTATQLNKHSQAIARSLYVFEVYDKNDPDQRVKISENILKAGESDAWVLPSGGTMTPNIKLSGTCEGTRLYVPAYVFAGVTGETSVYLRVSFFNATRGKRVYFSQSGMTSATEAQFLEVKINPTTRTYRLASAASTINLLEEPQTAVNKAVADPATRLKILGLENNRGEYQPFADDNSFPNNP